MTNNTICLLPGDGIGLEVIPIAIEILEVLDVDLTTEIHPIGWQCFNETGTALPKSTLDAVILSGIGLFGATSSPAGGAPGYSSPIIDLRQQLNLYANVRPAKSLPVPSSRQNIDLLIVSKLFGVLVPATTSSPCAFIKYSPNNSFFPVDGFLVNATPVAQSCPILPKTMD